MTGISLTFSSTALAPRLALALTTMLALAACDETGTFNPGSLLNAKPAETTAADAAAPTEFIEEEVEKPDVFYASEAGLWDGRPSLGGVWVAHPDVTEPERVIIRNKTNGKFVVSALFRREREVPGPRLQLSSDAAQAIGVIAGAPVELEVVALRTERTPVAPPEPIVVADAPIEAPEPIEATPLDPIAAASAAIDAAPATATASTIAASAIVDDASADLAPAEVAPELQDPEITAPEAPAATTTLLSMTKPFVQVAVFSVENNAQQVSEQMRSIGLIPTVREEGAGDAKRWRVLIGPATSRSERRDLIRQVRAEGYADAFSVAQ